MVGAGQHGAMPRAPAPTDRVTPGSSFLIMPNHQVRFLGDEHGGLPARPALVAVTLSAPVGGLLSAGEGSRGPPNHQGNTHPLSLSLKGLWL